MNPRKVGLVFAFLRLFFLGELTAASASYQAQDIFGQGAFTIPWYTSSSQFSYLNGWQRAVVHAGNGFTPPGNYFLSLDAWNPLPPVPGTIRQGYSQATSSVNPFIGSTPWDTGVIGSVYDSIGMTNPSAPSSLMDWMTVKTDQLSTSVLTYTPPTGTVAAFRYTLRNDIYWHTGQKVTAWDVAFTFAALKLTGVRGELVSLMTGVKVLGPTQLDVDVSEVGQFTRLLLSTIVLPARDWVATSVCKPSTWDTAASNANFEVANSVLTGCIASSGVTGSGVITGTQSNIDTAKVQPTYDPVADSNLIGSGPWVCTNGGLIGQSCSPNRTQQVPVGGSWIFQRYGRGTAPGGSLNTYFRSSGTAAMWIWSGDSGSFSQSFLNFAVISGCFGKPVGTPGCTHWQYGIGGSPAGEVIGLTQVSIVLRFVGVSWLSPYDWITSPPQNIALYPPVLHEGSVTLNPCTIDPVNGYDC